MPVGVVHFVHTKGARELLQFEYHKEVFMLKRVLLAASAAISIPLIFSGVSLAQQVVCNPLCSPAYNNPRSDGNHRAQGLTRADDVAGVHGSHGRENAKLKSGYVDPTPPAPTPPPPPTPPTLDPLNTNPLVVAPTCSLC